MKPIVSLALFAAFGLLSSGSGAAVDTSQWKCEKCPYPKGTTAEVTAGVGVTSEDAPRFGNYTGLDEKGAHLLLGGSVMHRGDDGYHADLEVTDLGLDVRRLLGEAGREGIYWLRLGYAEIPRHLTQSAASPYLGIGSDTLTLPAGFPAPDTRAMPLATTLRPVALGFDHQRLDLAGTLYGGARWTWRASLTRQQRDGTKPATASFFNNAAQLALPVDETSDDFELAASYHAPGMAGTLALQLSQFGNGSQALTFANPFTSPATRGQLALAPDNRAVQLVGSALWQVLPMVTLSGDVAIGRLTQDEPFLAPTLSTGLGVPALPAASLDGRVDTFAGSLRASAAPLSGLRVNAALSRDRRDNRTAVRTWTLVSTDLFVDPVARSNTPFGITRDRFALDADYRLSADWKFAAGVDHDVRERSYQEVVETRETTVWGKASARPVEPLTLALKLLSANRDASTYGTAIWFGAPQNPLLRKLNLAERRRNAGELRADISIGESVSLGLAAQASDDDYRDVTIGLTRARQASLAADLSVTVSDQTQVSAFLHGERLRTQQAGSQSFAAPDWAARVNDRHEMFGLAVKHAAIPDKLDLGAEVSISRSRSETQVQTGVGEPPFPAQKATLDTVKLSATWRLNEKTSILGSWWYEDVDSVDWRIDGILPASVPNLLAFGDTAPKYRVHVLRVALRHRF